MPKNTFLNLNSNKKKRIMDAAINEFAKKSFQDAKISNIIIMSKIPRGSFYQYFNDKKDVYLYIFEMMGKEKLEILGDSINNPDNMSFTELYRQLFKKGLEFGISRPKYMKIYHKLLMSESDLYEEILGDKKKLTIQYYVSLIEKDKLIGNIRADVDSNALAHLIFVVTNQISVNSTKNDNFTLENMMPQVESLIKIISKGIE